MAQKWSADDRAKLVNCKNAVEVAEAFPGVNVETAMRKRRTLLQTQKGVTAVSKTVPTRDEELELARSERDNARRERDAALRKAERYHGRIAEYVATLRDAALEAMQDIKLDPPAPILRNDPTGRGKKSWADQTEEKAVLALGDWQLGKKTTTYDSAVARERVLKAAEAAIAIAKVQNAHHPVREINIHLLGDIVEGEGIFPTQSHVIDASLYRQMNDGVKLLADVILTLLTFFEKVNVVAVIGNHGDVRLANGAANPETNMDRLLYSMTRSVLSGRGFDERLTWDIPEGADERNWYAVSAVYNTRFLLCHGDQIRGGITGFWPSAQRKGLGWIDSIPEEWNVLMFGHHHTPTRLTIGRRLAFCNGTTESSNTYAQENLAAIGKPVQLMLFVHPQRGITAEHWLNLW